MCQTGMGIVGLSWTEIHSWVAETKLSLSVWEKLTLSAMSGAYANEYNQASDKDRPAPYVQELEVDEFDREALAVSILGQLRAMKRNQG